MRPADSEVMDGWDWCEMKKGADLNLLGLQMQHVADEKPSAQ